MSTYTGEDLFKLLNFYLPPIFDLDSVYHQDPKRSFHIYGRIVEFARNENNPYWNETIDFSSDKNINYHTRSFEFINKKNVYYIKDNNGRRSGDLLPLSSTFNIEGEDDEVLQELIKYRLENETIDGVKAQNDYSTTLYKRHRDIRGFFHILTTDGGSSNPFECNKDWYIYGVNGSYATVLIDDQTGKVFFTNAVCKWLCDYVTPFVDEHVNDDVIIIQYIGIDGILCKAVAGREGYYVEDRPDPLEPIKHVIFDAEDMSRYLERVNKFDSFYDNDQLEGISGAMIRKIKKNKDTLTKGQDGTMILTETITITTIGVFDLASMLGYIQKNIDPNIQGHQLSHPHKNGEEVYNKWVITTTQTFRKDEGYHRMKEENA